MTVRLTNPVLVLYLLVTYVLPALANWITGYKSDIYADPSSSVFSWLYAGTLFGIVAAFAFSRESESARSKRLSMQITPWDLPVRTLIVILLSVLGVALAGTASGMSRWRYAAGGLSSSDLDLTTLLYVLAPNLLQIVLFVLVFLPYRAQRMHRNIALLLVAADMALTATGIGPMLSVLLAAVAYLAPDILKGLLFRSNNASWTDVAQIRVQKVRLVHMFILCVVTLILGMCAYVIGEAIKTGADVSQVVDRMSENGRDAFLSYIIGRLSVHWYSLKVAVNKFIENGVDGQFDYLLAPITNAWFRLSSLTGGWLAIERPLNGSLGRVNYLLINYFPLNDREGSSPGLIASFLIAFPPWLAPFALGGYLSIYHAVQGRLRERLLGRLTWMGETLLLYFTSVFFTSPVDFLLIFDPMVFAALGWVGLAFATNSPRKRKLTNSGWRPPASPQRSGGSAVPPPSHGHPGKGVTNRTVPWWRPER